MNVLGLSHQSHDLVDALRFGEVSVQYRYYRFMFVSNPVDWFDQPAPFSVRHAEASMSATDLNESGLHVFLDLIL